MGNENNVPLHVAIIMDGNGRWAERRDLPRTEGHRAGAHAVETVLAAARELGVKYLTLYAFSTENWKRSPLEVSALMGLLGEFLDSNIEKMMENNVRILTIGHTADLPNPSRRKLLDAIERTKNNDGWTLTLALSYGGRAEITDCARELAMDAAAGKIDPRKIDEKLFSSRLYHPDVPDPDLMIRTSGELRISNFMLWQLAYAEFYVTDLLWPDFNKDEFAKAIESYNSRERRFGGRKSNV